MRSSAGSDIVAKIFIGCKQYGLNEQFGGRAITEYNPQVDEMKKERRAKNSEDETREIFLCDLRNAHKRSLEGPRSGAFKTPEGSARIPSIDLLREPPYRAHDIKIIRLPVSLQEASGETEGDRRKERRK